MVASVLIPREVLNANVASSENLILQVGCSRSHRFNWEIRVFDLRDEI